MHIKCNIFYDIYSILTKVYKQAEQYATKAAPFFGNYALCGSHFIQAKTRESSSLVFACVPIPLFHFPLREFQRLLIAVQNDPLNAVPGRGINRMGYIPVFPVAGLLAGHGNKQPLVALYDLDIMHHEFIIQCNGNNRLHLSFFGYFPHSYICDLHIPSHSAAYAAQTSVKRVQQRTTLHICHCAPPRSGFCRAPPCRWN